MRKFFVFLLAALMLTGFTGCKGGGSRPEDKLLVTALGFDFDGELLRGDVIRTDEDAGEWVFISPKTTDLKEPDTELIYSDKPDRRPNWSNRMNKPRTPAEKAIWQLYTSGKFFYADNQCGETIRTYLMTCGYNWR